MTLPPSMVIIDLPLNDVSALRMAQFVLKTLRDRDHPWSNHIADQIIEQLSPRPLGMPEPTGFAPVVEAGIAQHDERMKWYRNRRGNWTPTDEREYARPWSELIDPVPIRPGIEERP